MSHTSILHLPSDWQQALRSELASENFTELAEQVAQAYATETIYPPLERLWTAFALTPLSAVKVVIIGQDPYHGAGQAHGLAFSVPDGVSIPPSLRNIFLEIESNIGTKPPTSGNLTHWAKQGVLLLNSSLTVQAGQAGSHQKLGWERFTDTVIQIVSKKQPAVVFLLWGAHATAKQSLIDTSRHLMLTAPHPSPLSAYRGFFGCQHFSQTNQWLKEHSLPEIMW